MYYLNVLTTNCKPWTLGLGFRVYLLEQCPLYSGNESGTEVENVRAVAFILQSLWQHMGREQNSFLNCSGIVNHLIPDLIEFALFEVWCTNLLFWERITNGGLCISEAILEVSGRFWWMDTCCVVTRVDMWSVGCFGKSVMMLLHMSTR